LYPGLERAVFETFFIIAQYGIFQISFPGDTS